MRNIVLIAKRELASYLRTMSGYVIIAGILFALGLLFNVLAMAGGTGRPSSEVMSLFFYYTGGATMFCAVLLSMRLLAEERQTGTLALLYSSPIRDSEIVLGKFFAAVVFLMLFHVASFYIPLLIMAFG